LSASAFAQYAGNTQQAPYTNPVTMVDHTQHASQHAMGTETSLLEHNSTTSAQGERPVIEFPIDIVEPPPETPLGDVARFYRAKKEAEDAAKPKEEIVVAVHHKRKARAR
jgi:hypothetical protein